MEKKKLSLFTFPMNLNWIDKVVVRNEKYSIGKDDFQQMKGNGI